MRQSDSPISIAFLGCGSVTLTHSKTLAKVARDVDMRYASRVLSKAQEYNARFGGRGAFGSYDAAIHDPSVGVIVVATPPVSHLDLTLSALRAGKDVIVEKPPFLRAADFATVRRVCSETGRRMFVAENYFYKPLLGVLRDLLGDGVVGRPLFLQVNALRMQRTQGWRDDPAVSGSGALFEGGIHWIDFLSNLGFSIESIRGFQPGRDGKPDRSMLVVIEYSGGPIGTLHYSWEVPSLLRGLRLSRISGTQGSITFETNGLFVAVHGRNRRLSIPNLRDVAGYRGMWKDFLGALRSSKEPALSFEIAERDLKLVETIYATLE